VLRSVDSELVGCVIEPRNLKCGSRRRRVEAEGNTETLQWPGVEVSPGSKSGACGHGGLPGTQEALSSLPESSGVGRPEEQTLLAYGEALLDVGAKLSAKAVPPSEGNEVRREGDRESEHPSSTCEAGEVFPRRPGGGKGDAELGDRWRET
jgi:hypothetical protein